MWICGGARAERLKLGKGWQVRIPLHPWRSKVPVSWTAPIVGRRPASERELLIARAYTPGWPPPDHPGYDAAFVLIDSLGDERVFPQGVRLILQRLRTPQRDREAKEWSFT
jgi:hypothetical protein